MNQNKSQWPLSKGPVILAAGLTFGLLCLNGCSHGSATTPMSAASFMPKDTAANDGAALSVSGPAGPLTNDNPPPGPSQANTPRADVVPNPMDLPNVRPIPELGTAGLTAFVDPSPALPAAVISPAPSSPIVGSTVPSAGSGQYMSVGGVMVQVGKTPIYASQVLSVLDKEFAVRSRDMSPGEFKYFARKEIYTQLHEQIENEKYFTIAEKSLGADDIKLAHAIAESLRHDRLVAVGGSEQLARKKCSDDGTDFDDQLNQDFRAMVVEVYNHRHVDPLIQVSADDMREFYRQNVEKLYTQKEKIQFRVLMIDPEAEGGGGPHSDVVAAEKITGIREKAVHGDDFSHLAATENDDDYLKSTGGSVGIDGWMDRNGYRVAPVDQAVWKLDVGQVTDVINVNGSFFIAKVEQKKVARVRPFDEQAVQDEIYARLYKQQSMTIRSQLLEGADEDSMVTPLGGELQARVDMAVDMATQKYARR